MLIEARVGRQQRDPRFCRTTNKAVCRQGARVFKTREVTETMRLLLLMTRVDRRLVMELGKMTEVEQRREGASKEGGRAGKEVGMMRACLGRCSVHTAGTKDDSCLDDERLVGDYLGKCH